MGKALAFAFGLVSYLVFLATFLYAIGFVGNLFVPRTIDAGGEAEPFWKALVINALLLGLFAVQHSVMARPAFKRWWTRFVPRPVERSVYVLLSSLALILLFWQWRPMTEVVWSVENAAGRFVLLALFWAGWLLVLASTFLINHFDLFGLRQVNFHRRGLDYEPLPFKVSYFYRVVRHPLLLGFVVAFWATPRMTVGHLVFAVATTAYILVAIQLEERDLVASHGEAYQEYRRQVPMLIPLPGKKAAPSAEASREKATV